MNRTLVSLALFAVCSLAAQAQTRTPELDAKVRELLRLTGSADIASQMLGEMLPALKDLAPGVPESVWSDIEKEMNAEELVELLVPVYVEEFTVAEIDAMLAFYRTPEGQSVVRKLPTVMQRSMEIGQQWGTKAAERVFERLSQKGYAPKS